MVFPSLIVRLSAPIGEWWLPGLGVLLAGCGVGLLAASAGELVAPTHPADSAVLPTVAVVTIASRVAPPAPAVGEAWPGSGKVALATPSGAGGNPAPGAGAVPREAEGLDLAAAALYGPPDRRPQATQEALLEEGVLDGGRSRARDYFEETATTRFLGP
jgi:hypothetical protein